MKFNWEIKTPLIFILLTSLIACSSQEVAPTQISRKTLPATWTPQPATATLDLLTPTFTPKPLPPTPSPYPAGYQDSTWLIDIQAPDRWYSAEQLIMLSDGTILALGDVYSTQNKFQTSQLTTFWVARLSVTGELFWIKYIPLPWDDEFFPFTLVAGPDSTGLLSGSYSQDTGDGRIKTHRISFSFSSQGNIQWIIPIPSGYKEGLADGSILLQNGIQTARIVDSLGTDLSQLELDFGAGYGGVMEYPFPDLEIAHQLPDGDWLFAGTIADIYWGESHPDRSGRMEGNTAYWYARFGADGGLRWKHLHSIAPLQQSIHYMTLSKTGEIVITGGDTHGEISYIWIRKINADGKTVFHRRYPDLPLAWDDPLSTGYDGSSYFWGRKSIPQGEYEPELHIASLVKVSPEGDLEWIRTFPNHVVIKDVLPLRDGSLIISLRVPTWDITLARIDASGNLPGCSSLPMNTLERWVDQQPALFDTAGGLPLTLRHTKPDPAEDIQLPPFEFISKDTVLIEICRTLAEPVD